jgi:hypothetical protein
MAVFDSLQAVERYLRVLARGLRNGWFQ